MANRPSIAIASEGEVGALYGTFHFLRLMQTGQPIDRLNLERPEVQLRLINHWDNSNGTIERGYAGRSLWQWNELPGKLGPRYSDYARASASIGINGAVDQQRQRQRANALRRNTSERSPRSRTCGGPTACACICPRTSPRRCDWADCPRPIRSTSASPIGGRPRRTRSTGSFPDFGGFLVKANSEGQPGPKDYGRTHAEGANVLADALAPHEGNVMWRAFVYDEDVDPDRAKRAYIEFTRLDGKFRPNVLVQVKNGAIDFSRASRSIRCSAR